jgi:hypothetical protein
MVLDAADLERNAAEVPGDPAHEGMETIDEVLRD